MRNLVLTTPLLVLILCTVTGQQCNTPLLRDVISVDADKTTYTRQNIGDQPSFITGLPIVDTSDPLTIRISNPVFTTALIDLIATNRQSPNYWITAIDIQQGPAGSNCRSTGVIQDLAIEFKVYQAYTGLTTPFKSGTTNSDSLPFYNWKDFGGTSGNGRTTRISFEPTRVDGVRFKIRNIDPLDSSVPSEVCMRVEIYGCKKDPRVSAAPSVNSGPLHQYNLVQPSADTYGNLYTDSSYTGITSDGYMSGGTGILTDGIIGGNAQNTPAQWLGWKKSDTPSIEVLFLLKASQQFNKVKLFYWDDSSSQVSAPVNVSISDNKGNTFTFDAPDLINHGGNVRVLSLTKSVPVLASYLKVSMQYGAGADFILLTEVEFVREDGINALTNSNETISTSPTSTPTPSPTPTNTTTIPTTIPPTNTTTLTTTPTTPTTTTPTPVTTTTAQITTIIATTTATDPPVTTTAIIPETTSTTTVPITTTTTEVTTQPTTTTTTTTATDFTTTDTLTDNTTSKGAVGPTGISGIKTELLGGLIFIIILLIILILAVILLVICFYYMRSKGKHLRDLNCLGKMGGFKLLSNGGDPELGQKGLSKFRALKLKSGRGGYDPVNGTGLVKPKISDPVVASAADNPGLEEQFSPEAAKTDDLFIYAPKDAIYSSIVKGKKTNKVYEESQFDLSLPSTPLDNQGPTNLLQPISSIYEMPALLIKEEGPLDLTWLDIVEKEFLGNGHFGEVWLAQLTNYSAKDMGLGASGRKGIEIAVKKLSSEATQETKDTFSKEVKFMARLDHPNVIKLLGVCLEETGGGRFLAMEYMVNGDLAQFLKDSDFVDSIGANLRIQEVNQDCMVYMGQQVAAGMEYLSDRNYIHRDLSARNCLVGCNYTVKVADFGMSQNLYSSEYFKITGRAILPIRWMPNESFYGKFTLKSDVWSFGVTLWEIFNKCELKPYKDMSDHEIIQDVLTNKNERVKLDKPVYVPEQAWDLIRRCTDQNPDNRPGFEELRRELEDMCKFQIEEFTI